MNANTCFLIAFCVGEGANLLHWGAERGEQFHYQPKSGWLWIVMVLLIVAMIAGVFLYLAGIAAAPNMVWAMTGFSAFEAIYSIAHRHHLRRQWYLQHVASSRPS
jgi:hypothetical protein